MIRREIEYTVTDANQLPFAIRWAQQKTLEALRGGTVVFRLGRESRTISQNKKLWPMLTDLSKQINWQGKRLTPDQWKDLVTGSFAGQEPMQGLNGGLVFIGKGRSTSNMRKDEFADLIEFIYSTGAELGVKWSEPALACYETYREANNMMEAQQ